jgi:hypothetical protein
MATSRIIPFPSCGMLVRVPYATRSGARRTGSQENLRNLRQGRCLCSSPPSKRPRRTAWASTRSSFISTTITSWGFTHGSSCGTGVRARSARRRGPTGSALIPRNAKAPISQGQIILGYLQHPATCSSIDRDNFQSSYFCRKLSLLSLPNRTRAQNAERGPDWIQARTCYRRRVLCSHYTTGPK